MRRLLLIAASLAACSLAGGAARAEEAETRAPHDLDFVVMPIPISDPAIGNGLALTGLAMYKASGSQRPWTSALAGLYTDSSSWAVVFAQKAYIDADRYRVTVGGGVGDFHVDYFGIGVIAGDRNRSIPIEQKAGGGLAEVLVRVRPHFYAGLEYRIVDIRTVIDLSGLPFDDLEIPQQERRSRTSALGLAAEYDTRDSEYQPRRGLYATGTWLKASESLGGDFDYMRFEAAVNGYHALGDKTVLAWRGSVCSAGDEAPFYDICNFGSQNDLRGYLNGRYRDHAMYAVQAEYRRKLFWRIGATAFAGVGEVAPSFDRMSTDNLLPAAGVGLRFQASKTYDINARIDVAWGKDSNAVYFSVGEAF